MMLSWITPATMCGDEGKAWRLPPSFFFLLFEGLAIDAEGGDGTGFESRIGNLFFAAFTDAVDVLVDSTERFVYFFDQSLFALTDPHRKILIGFRRGLIAHIRERFLPVWVG